MRTKVRLVRFLLLAACCFALPASMCLGVHEDVSLPTKDASGRDESRPYAIAPGRFIVGAQFIAPDSLPSSGNEVVEGEALVRFRSQTTAESRAEIHREARAQVIAYLPALRLCRVKVEGDVSAALSRYRAHPEVEIAEPHYISRVCLAPDDPLLPFQWSLAQIEAPSAWDLWKGRSTTIVAIVDSGVDLDHPDLAGKIWRNPAETLNGVDGNANGYVDDLFGWDFVHANPDPNPDPNGADDNGDGITDAGAAHGTAVAGIAAAATDNGLGVAGLGWRISLMAIQTHDDEGLATYFDLAAGVVYAADMGAAVINLSTAGPFSQIMQSAVDYAYSHGAIVVAAAGNSSQDLDEMPASPICNDGDSNKVIGVAATGVGDLLADYSNYGSLNVDLSAPGTEILTSLLIEPAFGFNAEYEYLTGTSMATPLVSALAALARSANPSLTNNAIRGVLQATVDSIDALNPAFAGEMGTGRINARKAIQSLMSGDRIPPEPPSALLATDLGSGGAVLLSWTASPSSHVAGYVLYQGTQQGNYTLERDVGNVTSYPSEHLTDGTNYYFALSAYDSSVPPNESLLSPPAQATPSSTQYVSLGGGLNLFSLRVALLPGSDTPEALFGSVPFTLYAWDTRAVRYRTYPNPSVAWLEPRRGYWVSLSEPKVVQARGAALDVTSPVAIDLEAGWNLIGSPFASALPWDPGAIQVQTTSTKSLFQAAQEGEVADYAWTFLNGAYAPVTDIPLPGALSQLEAGRGYWLLAYRAATLLLPAPVLGAQTVGASAQGLGGRPKVAGVINHAPTTHRRGAEGHLNTPLFLEIRAVASTGNQGPSRDNIVLGRAGRRISLCNPPAPLGVIDLAVVGFGGATFSPLAYDLRRELPPEANWEITVSGAAPGTDVALTWPDLRSLPRDLSPVLVDLHDNKTILMRTASAYTFKSDGETRHLRVILAGTRPSAPIALAITPLRGLHGVEVAFSLPAPGSAEVEILTLTGSLVWKSGGRSVVSGAHSLPWDARDAQRRLVPAGSYLCILHVEYDTGEKESAVRSFVLG